MTSSWCDKARLWIAPLIVGGVTLIVPVSVDIELGGFDALVFGVFVGLAYMAGVAMRRRIGPHHR